MAGCIATTFLLKKSDGMYTVYPHGNELEGVSGGGWNFVPAPTCRLALDLVNN